MDCFVSIAVGSVLILTLINKGYTDAKQQVSILIKAGIVACVGLALIYGGLTYLGATVSTVYNQDVQAAKVIVNITHALLGNTGKTVLAVAVSLACLTTSIGLTSATADYLSELSGRKISYERVVLFVCLFSTAAATLGVSGLVKIANPILAIVYPPTIVLIVLAFFNNKIKNDNIYKVSVLVTVIISALTLLSASVPSLAVVNSLPLGSLGFNWVVPAIIGGVVGKFIPSKL